MVTATQPTRAATRRRGRKNRQHSLWDQQGRPRTESARPDTTGPTPEASGAGAGSRSGGSDPSPPVKPARRTIAQRYAAVVSKHPELLERFIELAKDELKLAQQRNLDRVIAGLPPLKLRLEAKKIAALLREELWKYGDRGYSLNNDFVPSLARDAMRLEPALAGLFELRERKAHAKPRGE